MLAVSMLAASMPAPATLPTVTAERGRSNNARGPLGVTPRGGALRLSIGPPGSRPLLEGNRNAKALAGTAVVDRLDG